DKGVSASCGIELDTSVGETERAGVYLQYRKHTDLIAPFLASIGEEVRAESYLAVADPTVPEYAEPCRNGGWQTSAGGSSPARRSLAMCRLTEKTDPGGRFALCRMFNYAKVKFAGTVAQPAKFYLRMSAGEVEA
ncbi:MAG: hypothetical protein U0J70_12475, partial [Atopobiaceae bacterium]|nr:hypothetical protein [Atopobiaceae bacterium]